VLKVSSRSDGDVGRRTACVAPTWNPGLVGACAVAPTVLSVVAHVEGPPEAAAIGLRNDAPDAEPHDAEEHDEVVETLHPRSPCSGVAFLMA
jgi:hypothetical protein